MNKLSEILIKRRLISQYSGESLEAITDKPKTVYVGIDPTGDSFHVGHLIPLLTANYFRINGHKVVLLIGEGTARIGDPSGKNIERPILSNEKIKKNTKQLISQVDTIFGKNKFSIVNNLDWLGNETLISFLRNTGKHFTVNTMLQKDNVRRRIQDPEQSISYAEFSYSLLQAYDYWHLYKSKNCTIQIGGSDQWGNITAGIDLIRRKEAVEVYGLTTPLTIDKTTGKKFGKTESGSIWLDANKTTPYAFYQFWLNIDDENVIDFLTQYTHTPLEKIQSISCELKRAPENRLAQKLLAKEMTKMIHGQNAVNIAQKVSQVLFEQGSIKNLSNSEKQILIQETPSTKIGINEFRNSLLVVDILIITKIASSKREARDLLNGGGVQIDGKKVIDINAKLYKDDFKNGLLILRKGKKSMHIIHTA